MINLNPGGITMFDGIGWLYKENGEKKGPFSEIQMIEFISAGIVTNDSPVWTEGFLEWQKLENTELGVYLQDMPPPLPFSERANTNVASGGGSKNDSVDIGVPPTIPPAVPPKETESIDRSSFTEPQKPLKKTHLSSSRSIFAVFFAVVFFVTVGVGFALYKFNWSTDSSAISDTQMQSEESTEENNNEADEAIARAYEVTSTVPSDIADDGNMKQVSKTEDAVQQDVSQSGVGPKIKNIQLGMTVNLMDLITTMVSFEQWPFEIRVVTNGTETQENKVTMRFEGKGKTIDSWSITESEGIFKKSEDKEWILSKFIEFIEMEDPVHVVAISAVNPPNDGPVTLIVKKTKGEDDLAYSEIHLNAGVFNLAEELSEEEFVEELQQSLSLGALSEEWEDGNITGKTNNNEGWSVKIQKDIKTLILEVL